MGSQAYDTTGPDFHDDISSGSMQLAHIGNGVSVESPSPNYIEDPASPLNNMEPALETTSVSSGKPMASSQPQHTGQSTTSTSSAEAGMLKPPVIPLLNGDHRPASMEAETTSMTHKPSVPPQPARDHYPESTEAVTAIVMITVGFQEVWDFIRTTLHGGFSGLAVSA